MPEWLVLTVGIVVTVVLVGGWIVISLILRHRHKTSSVHPDMRAAYRSAAGPRGMSEGLSRGDSRHGDVGP